MILVSYYKISVVLVYTDCMLIMNIFYFSEKIHKPNDTVIYNTLRRKFSLRHYQVFKNFSNIKENENCSETTHLKGYKTEVLHYTNIYISRYFITTMEATVYKLNYFTFELSYFNKLRREIITLRHKFALGPPYRVMRNVRGIQIDQFANEFEQNTYLSVKKETFYGTNNNCSVKYYLNQYTTDVLLHCYSNRSRYAITKDVVIYKLYYFSPSNIYTLELEHLDKLKEKTLHQNNPVRHKFDLGSSIKAIRSTYITIYPTCKLKNPKVKKRMSDKVVKEIVLDVISVS